MTEDKSAEQVAFGFAQESDSSSSKKDSPGRRWLEQTRRRRQSEFGTYEELVEAARKCTSCSLREGCRQVVVGDGSTDADIMFVGEGPGAQEDRLGKAFVGRAGQLLDKILAAVDLTRQEVYITNTVLCRPPGNRTPKVNEIRTCAPYLNGHIELIEPRILVALGSTAARALISPRARITRLRGTWHEYRDIPLLPTFHPAALLRDPSKKRPVWEDFKKLRTRLDQLQETG